MNLSAIPKRYITILSFTFIAFIFLNGRAIAKDTIIATNSGPSVHQTISKPLTFTDIKIKTNVQLAEANTKSYLPKQKAKYKKKKQYKSYNGKIYKAQTIKGKSYSSKKIAKIHAPINSALRKYRSRVGRHLAKHKIPPGPWYKGKVVIGFTVSRDGKVSNIQLLRRSKYKRLNRAALAMPIFASPFPRIPYGGPSYMKFTVPIKFTRIIRKKSRRKSKKRKNKK